MLIHVLTTTQKFSITNSCGVQTYNRSELGQFESLKVVGNVIIQYNTYDFLFTFHRNYVFFAETWSQYVKGLSEVLTRILKTYRICTAVKPHITLKNMLVHLKDRISNEENSEVIYKILCKNCELSFRAWMLLVG